MKFTKMHGAGNDYIYIDCFEQQLENPVKLAKTLCKRRFSVGGDGIVLIYPSKTADCFMDIYNADGSRAEMCGNAVRCVARYIYEKHKKEKTVFVDTLSGIKTIEISQNGGIVNMGKPILEGHRIPTRYGKSIVRDEKIYIENNYYEITCVSMGNPHCVVFQDNIDNLNLQKIGTLFENHEMFPERINTEFVQVITKNHLKMRVWERGSGETLACGTGACAVAVASVIKGISSMNEKIQIDTLGGKLFVVWSENGDVFLEGDTIFAFEGEVEI